MNNKQSLDHIRINNIIKKVIFNIDSSRDQILNIIDNARTEYENLKAELAFLQIQIKKVIQEADSLEIEEKRMRKKLAHVSKNFHVYSEDEVKKVYDKTYEIKIAYSTKQNEEKNLRDKRTQVELSLKKIMSTIENADKTINQITIAASFLKGEVLSAIEGIDKNAEMLLGIKILEAQENERKRISRDIHDGPAQRLANIIMKADICEKIITNDLEEGLKELTELKDAVKLSLEEVRHIIYDLRPMTLDDLGLNKTIEEFISSFRNETGIDIKINIQEMKTGVESIIQVAFYRIIQEIFNNIYKHAQASKVDILVEYGTKYLRLKISDDGVGFNLDETMERIKLKGESYGIIGILDRVNQLQGEIDINTNINQGTKYIIKLPVSREVIEDENWGN